MATLRQLEYLVTVVDTGSFTRAAELLHVSQPALSHQVRALERDTGGPLLERLPRAVRLTPMGRAMLPHARAALADAERARTAARRAVGLDGGGAHTEALVDAMTAGRADLAVGPAPRSWDGPVRELGTEEFVVVVADDDPAATGEPGRVALAALADRDWVHYAPGNGLAEVLDQACAAAGFQPRTAVRTEQTAAAPLLAAAGLGRALVPANIVPPGFGGRLLHPDPPVRRLPTAYTRPHPDPLTTAFLDTLARDARVVPEHARRTPSGT
ncbi:LysR substrate-binding domain-containing protein [Streptomyces sp. NPDC002870]|uniref:LysR family transcriptional regulator n=1 Tax=Streptomyces sp. NPDC002870 TaxID=3364666 RepID=UPI0036CDD261